MTTPSKDLATYLTHLQSLGRVVFTAAEATKELGIKHGAFLDAAERLQRRRSLLRLRPSFYVIVPAHYSSWGAPPPTWFIHDLMHHEHTPYYIGILKAAELHGATHHAVMEFQVVATKRIRRLRAGRSLITFFFRKSIQDVRDAITDWKTDTGRMQISSIELTALDLFRYSRGAGGTDHIATVLSDLAPKLDALKLAKLSDSFERPVVQRLGYILDHLGHKDRATEMWSRTSKHATSMKWVSLDPRTATETNAAASRSRKNERWRIIINRVPELDQ